MLIFGLVFVALLAGVQPFKMSLKAPQANETQHQQQLMEQSFYQQQQQQQQAILLSPPLAPQLHQAYYQMPLTQQRYEEQAPMQEIKGGLVRESFGTKGAAPMLQRQPLYQPPPMQFLQPQALAYLIVRPIAQQYQYLEPARYYQQQQHQEGVKGEPEQQSHEQQQQLPVDQEQEQQYQGSMFGKGKFMKLKSSLEQFAASAKAKLTLGSTYQVVSEETIQQTTQAPQQAPFEQTREEVQQVKDEQVQSIAQEPLSQERQPIEQAPEALQAQEQQREQTLVEARKEVQSKLASAKGQQQTLIREQTRLTGPSNFEPLRATKGGFEQTRQIQVQAQDQQLEQQQLKGH